MGKREDAGYTRTQARDRPPKDNRAADCRCPCLMTPQKHGVD